MYGDRWDEWTWKALKFTSLYDFFSFQQSIDGRSGWFVWHIEWLTFAGGVDEDDLFASAVDDRLLSLKEFSRNKKKKEEENMRDTDDEQQKTLKRKPLGEKNLINESCMALNSLFSILERRKICE